MRHYSLHHLFYLYFELKPNIFDNYNINNNNDNDSGNVRLAEIDGPVVKLELEGACGTCPSSSMTMKMGLERKLKERIPEIAEVIQTMPNAPLLDEAGQLHLHTQLHVHTHSYLPTPVHVYTTLYTCIHTYACTHKFKWTQTDADKGTYTYMQRLARHT